MVDFHHLVYDSCRLHFVNLMRHFSLISRLADRDQGIAVKIAVRYTQSAMEYWFVHALVIAGGCRTPPVTFA